VTDIVEELGAESAGEVAPAVTFEFGGRTFTPVERLDIRAIAALQRGDMNRALVLVLGPEQTAELLALDSDEPFDEKTLAALFDVVAKGQGASRGES
jgi:hypothetical protein